MVEGVMYRMSAHIKPDWNSRVHGFESHPEKFSVFFFILARVLLFLVLHFSERQTCMYMYIIYTCTCI